MGVNTQKHWLCCIPWHRLWHWRRYIKTHWVIITFPGNDFGVDRQKTLGNVIFPGTDFGVGRQKILGNKLYPDTANQSQEKHKFLKAKTQLNLSLLDRKSPDTTNLAQEKHNFLKAIMAFNLSLLERKMSSRSA